jgi:cytochrome b subunit of formate dehydrogenase/mono/diheme cytochrome c family protein
MSEQQRIYVRFPLARRIEHIVMLLSFGTLGLTGLPQKFPTWAISQSLVGLLGGIETVRLIHHTAAVVLMLGVTWHILVLGYKLYVRRERMTMLPSLQDVKDAIRALLYNIGLAKSRPQMGRFTFEEKIEYWAFVWGAIIMGLTGFMMWNPITTVKFLPGEVIPAAKAAHGAEAILAVLAIIIWHFYSVHLKIFNRSMWTGKLTEEEMLHEHPLELADIKAGVTAPSLNQALLRKRQIIYYPVAAVLALIMLSGIYAFTNSEQTVVTNIPPADTLPVYVPETPTPLPTLPPTPTASPTPLATTTGLESTPLASSALTWDADVGTIFQQKCSTCHGAAATAGLNLTIYADALKGAQDGPVIIPGNSADSKLVILQSAGGHPGQLTPEELEKIKSWIDGGAPEK